MTAPTTRPIRATLIMHSTRSDNLGVGALTVSEVAILRDVAANLGRAIETATAIRAKIAAAWEDRTTLKAEAAVALARGREKLGAYGAGLLNWMGKVSV